MKVRPRPYLVRPGGPGAVVDLELGDPRPLPGGEDRDEPVHLAVEPDPFEHPAAVRLHRAAEVVERDAREPGDQAVGEPRGDLAGEEGVLAGRRRQPETTSKPSSSRSSSRGMSAGSFWRSPSIGTRIVPRARSSAAESAAVWPQLRRRKATRTCSGSRSWISRELRRRPVGRPVVDEDQLVAQRERAEDASSSAWSGLDVLDFVVDGDQDRQVERSRRRSRRGSGDRRSAWVRISRPRNWSRYRRLMTRDSRRLSSEPSKARSSTSMATGPS